MSKEEEFFVNCNNLVKIYKIADLEVVALQGLDLTVSKGDILALVGPSGAGKSTLLNVIGGLDTPSAGKVQVANYDLLAMKDRQRVTYKREMVGFVWQQPSRNLLPYLSAKENVELPMMLNKTSSADRSKRANELLGIVGLANRSDFRPNQLSGGQQQRVAIAVALANNPPLLLGDEMTGQIDSQSAAEVFATLHRVHEAFNTTIILVTHDPLVSGLVDRVIAIRDGRTSTEIRRHRDELSGDVDEEEWVILDQAGRLQLPKSYVDSLALKERVKVRLEDDHVTVWPQHKVEEFIKLGAPEIAHFKPAYRTPITTNGNTLKVENVSREFDLGSEKISALKDVSFEVKAGRLVLIRGRSGCGKTTLLNIIAALDQPTQGDIIVGESSIGQMSESEIIQYRRRQISFIFQTFGLLPFLTVEENVEIPLRLVKTPREERNARVAEVLKLVSLDHRAKHRTYELSGGEQQRVAISRALVNRPSLLLADEPTGQLDSNTGATIIRLLHEIADQFGVTVIVASHDPNVVQYADTIIELKDGQIINLIDQTDVSHANGVN
ncbi:MAG TPA: ATP-binding cassette domain-containing protein [Anaerolineales bacterium]|nr:ATP-binding cassette domain-containing protein [Anaerolineales bacterium]